MRYYIIAGEASGDLHGSNLIREIRKLDDQAVIRCWGGDMMEQAGAELVKHYRELAFMGFIEVVRNLGTILKNIKYCKQDIERFKPDALILIDYPGFNLRIADWAKERPYKVIFYISPQVWAWKENRVKKMKQTIDKMMVILPFEKDYYKNRWNWEVDYVGHPLVEVIDNARKDYRQKLDTGSLKKLSDKPVVALLPGSRKQEILIKLPVMLDVSKYFPDLQFIVAKAPGQEDGFYQHLLEGYPNVSAVSGQTYHLLMQSEAALVTSGTATLETALFAVPEVVCYKGSNISYQIAKRLIKVKFISLVNLIMDREVVKELIQHDMNTEKLRSELERILKDPEKKQHLAADYKALHDLLAAEGRASAKAAQLAVSFMKEGK